MASRLRGPIRVERECHVALSSRRLEKMKCMFVDFSFDGGRRLCRQHDNSITRWRCILDAFVQRVGVCILPIFFNMLGKTAESDGQFRANKNNRNSCNGRVSGQSYIGCKENRK